MIMHLWKWFPLIYSCSTFDCEQSGYCKRKGAERIPMTVHHLLCSKPCWKQCPLHWATGYCPVQWYKLPSHYMYDVMLIRVLKISIWILNLKCRSEKRALQTCWMLKANWIQQSLDLLVSSFPSICCLVLMPLNSISTLMHEEQIGTKQGQDRLGGPRPQVGGP